MLGGVEGSSIIIDLMLIILIYICIKDFLTYERHLYEIVCHVDGKVKWLPRPPPNTIFYGKAMYKSLYTFKKFIFMN